MSGPSTAARPQKDVDYPIGHFKALKSHMCWMIARREKLNKGQHETSLRNQGDKLLQAAGQLSFDGC